MAVGDRSLLEEAKNKLFAFEAMAFVALALSGQFLRCMGYAPHTNAQSSREIATMSEMSSYENLKRDEATKNDGCSVKIDFMTFWDTSLVIDMKIKSNADMKTSTSNITLAINSNGDVSPEVPSEVTARSDIETVVRAKFPLLDIDSIVWRHDNNVATWQIPKSIRRRLNETETQRTTASNDSGLNDLSIDWRA